MERIREQNKKTDKWEKLKQYLKECYSSCQYWSEEVFNLHIQSKMQELENNEKRDAKNF